MMLEYFFLGRVLSRCFTYSRTSKELERFKPQARAGAAGLLQPGQKRQLARTDDEEDDRQKQLNNTNSNRPDR